MRYKLMLKYLLYDVSETVDFVRPGWPAHVGVLDIPS